MNSGRGTGDAGRCGLKKDGMRELRRLAPERASRVPLQALSRLVFALGAGSAVSAVAAAGAADQMLQATNRLRAESGLPALAADDRLGQAALAFAQYMARTDRYGHQADGREPAQRVEATGYDWCMVAENIAWQYSSQGFDADTLAQRLVQGWQQSPPHLRNMLDRRARQVGIATAQSPRSGRHYAVQLLARPCAAQR